MDPKAKKHFAEQQKLKAKLYPVRNIMHLHPRSPNTQCGIKANAVGLVSERELANHRYAFKPLSVPDWDSEGFEDGAAVKKRVAE